MKADLCEWRKVEHRKEIALIGVSSIGLLTECASKIWEGNKLRGLRLACTNVMSKGRRLKLKRNHARNIIWLIKKKLKGLF